MPDKVPLASVGVAKPLDGIVQGNGKPWIDRPAESVTDTVVNGLMVWPSMTVWFAAAPVKIGRPVRTCTCEVTAGAMPSDTEMPT